MNQSIMNESIICLNISEKIKTTEAYVNSKLVKQTTFIWEW